MYSQCYEESQLVLLWLLLRLYAISIESCDGKGRESYQLTWVTLWDFSASSPSNCQLNPSLSLVTFCSFWFVIIKWGPSILAGCVINISRVDEKIHAWKLQKYLLRSLLYYSVCSVCCIYFPYYAPPPYYIVFTFFLEETKNLSNSILIKLIYNI